MSPLDRLRAMRMKTSTSRSVRQASALGAPSAGRGRGHAPRSAATVGMVFLGDAVSTLKLVSIGLILAGVIGLNQSGVTP
jgi:hypothetical protein